MIAGQSTNQARPTQSVCGKATIPKNLIEDSKYRKHRGTRNLPGSSPGNEFRDASPTKRRGWEVRGNIENYGSKTRYALQSHKVARRVRHRQSDRSLCQFTVLPPPRKESVHAITKSGYREVCPAWFIQRPFSEFLRSRTEPDKRITIIGRGTLAIDLTRFSTPWVCERRTKRSTDPPRREKISSRNLKSNYQFLLTLQSHAATNSISLNEFRRVLEAPECSWITTLDENSATRSRQYDGSAHLTVTYRDTGR